MSGRCLPEGEGIVVGGLCPGEVSLPWRDKPAVMANAGQG